MHGKGVYTWKSGSRYEGDFINCLSNGFGVYKYASGDIYEGEWKNDKKHG